MKREVMLWNNTNTACVRASKIREISIRTTNTILDKEVVTVKGWYNKDEFFYFGDFVGQEKAKKFVEEINRKIEAKK